MVLYNCYVLGPDRKIENRYEVEAAADAEAMVKAAQAAPPSDIAPMIEVWDGARLVGVLAPQSGTKDDPAS
jgi:hypothetical protein